MAYTTLAALSTGAILTSTYVGQIKANFDYLKGTSGATALDDSVYVPIASGTNAKGLRLGTASSQFTSFQALDLSSVTYLLLSNNRYHTGAAWAQLNTRAGGGLLISNDALSYNTFAVSSSTPVERLHVDTVGVGIGTSAPQTPLQIVQGTGGGGFYAGTLTGIGASVTILPTGTLQDNLVAVFQARNTTAGINGSGPYGAGTVIVPSSGTQMDLYNSGGHVLSISSTGGNLVVSVTVGASQTYTFALFFVYS